LQEIKLKEQTEMSARFENEKRIYQEKLDYLNELNSQMNESVR